MDFSTVIAGCPHAAMFIWRHQGAHEMVHRYNGEGLSSQIFKRTNSRVGELNKLTINALNAPVEMSGSGRILLYALKQQINQRLLIYRVFIFIKWEQTLYIDILKMWAKGAYIFKMA